MGKRKLQGAKLRAKKRMKEQTDALQEQQAEQFMEQYVSTNESNIFIIDTVGESKSASTSNIKEKQQLGGKPTSSAKDAQQKKLVPKNVQNKVEKLLTKHTPEQLQQLVQKGQYTIDPKKSMAQLARPKRSMDTTKSTRYDIWNINTATPVTNTSSSNNNKDDKQIGDDDSSIPDPGIGGALAGTRPEHCSVKAKTLAATIAQNQTKKKSSSTSTDVPTTKAATITTTTTTTTKNATSKSTEVTATTTITTAATVSAKQGTEATSVITTTTNNNDVNTTSSKKKKKKKKKKNKKNATEEFENATLADSNTSNTNKKSSTVVAVDIAKAGQSYHPDPVAHQELLSQAVEAELLRERATQKLLYEPLAKGMSEETRALLVDDNDDSDDSDDDDDDDEDNDDNNKNNNKDDSMAVGPLPKRANKLTRAQRNKQKRIKQELVAMKKLRSEKKLLKQVGNLHRITKELKQQELASQKKQQEQQQEQLQQQSKLGANIEFKAFQYDPISAPTIPVVLPASIESKTTTTTASVSLRTIKPKGNLLMDRMQSYTDRKLIAKSKKSIKKSMISNRVTIQDLDKNRIVLEDVQQSKIKGRKTKKAKRKVVGLHNWNGPDYKILGC